MNCFAQNGLSQQCLQIVLQTIAEGLFIINTEGKIIYCNKSMENMTGLSSEELIGKECCTVMAKRCNPPPHCQLFSKGAINDFECTIGHVSGGVIPVLKSARVLTDPQGNIMGAVETLTDISKIKKAEARLQNLQARNKKLSGFKKLVGKSRSMQQLYNLIELASASRATVLITGETGTGKELVADAIHSSGERDSYPLIKINCSAIPETLLESELFGHAKGAFTGAVKDKPGRFEHCDGGTLFLDEIADLSPLIQVKLLRFLQDKSFERLGENVTRQADVRIIAATNLDLRELVQQGRFREDLFYRLKVFPIHTPPLRERKEDIGRLTDHFIAKFNNETGKKISGLTHDAALTLMDHCWPGNVRELENAIEHAFVISQSEKIDIFDLPVEIRKMEIKRDLCGTIPTGTIQNSLFLRPNISDELIIDTLRDCGGNRTEAAKRLGINRTTLWRKMQRMSR